MSDQKKFQTKKSLGQHFLNSPIVPTWMCDAADIQSGDVVVEVGPGTGILTKELLKRGARVIALEADTRAITVLEEECVEEISNGSLTVVHTDVRHFELSSLQLPTGSFKTVSNIPYYLSGMLFRTFLAGEIQPSCLVFLVQKEVAKRITTDISRGEKESLLSLSVKIFGKPDYVRTVSKGHFTPSPNVDSGILAVRNISRDNFREIEQAFFFEIIRLGFGQKRKQLLKNLSVLLDKKTLTNIFSTCAVSLSTRAEDLELHTWLTLVRALQKQSSTQ